MLEKEEFKKLNKGFWIGFQTHMSKTRNVNDKRINWINYRSDVKSIFIRLEVDGKGARLCFDIQEKDEELRNLIYEQMTELKVVLEDITVEKPNWAPSFLLQKRQDISRIYWENDSLNLYKIEDHQKIYEYLRERLIKFDQFYQEYKEILIAMVN